MEVPSSSPIYTPLKPRPRRVIEHVEPITLFASDADDEPHEPREPRHSTPLKSREAPVAAAATAPARAAREESVVRSSDEEPSDADEDATHLDDEFYWSFAQRPPPTQGPSATIENSILAEEPLEFPSSISSARDAGEETVLSDADDDAQHTDSDTTALELQDTSQPKSTQNYLSELLTDSLLESLPLPPDRKQHLRDIALE